MHQLCLFARIIRALSRRLQLYSLRKRNRMARGKRWLRKRLRIYQVGRNTLAVLPLGKADVSGIDRRGEVYVFREVNASKRLVILTLN